MSESAKGGGGTTLFSYNKITGETRNAGALFPSDTVWARATGEGISVCLVDSGVERALIRRIGIKCQRAADSAEEGDPASELNISVIK
jgi:hypothetical protein